MDVKYIPEELKDFEEVELNLTPEESDLLELLATQRGITAQQLAEEFITTYATKTAVEVQDENFANVLFNRKYNDPEIVRLSKIYFNCKKNRIKNKLFKRIFKLCLDDQPVIILKEWGVVLMKYDAYEALGDVM